MNENEVIEALKRTGFPFEVRVRKKLQSLGLDTAQSRYYSFEKEVENSRDLDILGMMHCKTVNTSLNKLSIRNILQLVGEIKDHPDCDVICFYELEEKPDNLMLIYPNFLNSCFSLTTFLAGNVTLSDFKNMFGDVSSSKSICEFTKTGAQKGNSMLYKVTQGLAQACEYLHKQKIKNYINNGLSFPIHSCLPFCVTNSKIYRVVVNANGESVSIKPTNYFIYLSTYRDLDAIPLTAKERNYFPILVTNFDGLDQMVDLFHKISDELDLDVENLAKVDASVKKEYDDFVKLVMMQRSDKAEDCPS